MLNSETCTVARTSVDTPTVTHTCKYKAFPQVPSELTTPQNSQLEFIVEHIYMYMYIRVFLAGTIIHWFFCCLVWNMD